MDLRDYALAFNILVTALLFLVLRPKPIILYWCLVCIGFWYISLYSEPQGYPPPLDTAFAIFLPTLFVAYAFWRLAFRFVLPAFTNAPLERAVWYLAAFWPGVLLNIVTAGIPIDRLVGSDIGKRPGAVTAVIVIGLILLAIVVNQIRVIRKTGWLPKYLAWYIAGALVALVLSQLPNLQLRLHHYIFAMALIPGTAFPTRLSAIYQAFMLGMFLNGVAAWGFDSILQTAEDVRLLVFSSLFKSFLIIAIPSCVEMRRRDHHYPPSSRIRRRITRQFLCQIRLFSGIQSRMMVKDGMDSHCSLTTLNATLVQH